MHNIRMLDRFFRQPDEQCIPPDTATGSTPPSHDTAEFWRKSSGSARIMRYLSLVYSGFFIIQPLYEHSVEKWVWFGIVYVAFLALYFAIPNTVGRVQQMLLAQLFALGFVYFPFNQSASGLFVYPMVILAFMTRSMRLYVSILLAQTVGILIETWLFHLQWWTASMGIIFSVVIGVSNFLYSLQRRTEFQLHRANDEIEHLAQVAERERIARDLHDLLGHTLTVIAIKSELANRILPVDPERAALEMREVEQTARKALAEVREAVTGFRSEGIDAEVMRARQALLAADVQLTTSVDSLDLTPSQANVLCLALREAVTNIVRHAQASAATLRVQQDGHRVRLQMQDNGVGPARAEGNGLLGMRERVGKLGGQVELRRTKSSGTELTVLLPLAVEDFMGTDERNLLRYDPISKVAAALRVGM